MTKVPIGPSTSAEHWRQLGALGLEVAKKAAALAGRWSMKMWPRLIALLRQLELVSTPSSPPPLPGRLTLQSQAPKPIPVHARGYVYHFNIHATFTWSSQGVSPDFLSWSVQNFMPQAIESLRRIAADRARSFEADQAQELEEELQGHLSKLGPWRYERGESVIVCEPHVRVELDDPVRETIRPHWDERIKFKHQQELHLTRAQSAKQLSDQWVTILQRHVECPLAGGADNARNQELADALQRMMSMQKDAAKWIEDLLSKRMRDDNVSESDKPLASDLPEDPPKEAA
ncbi:hypothetical protein ACNAW0_07375 [Micromonospora sp. SL1-18]|uniref:hypothetical protein n=1 Tax=Micromonospora sp. SL1-18 TaxID=3399128 RepID=UPI003A4D7E37